MVRLEAPSRSKLFLCHPVGALLPHGAPQLKRSLMQPEGVLVLWVLHSGPYWRKTQLSPCHQWSTMPSGTIWHDFRSFCEGEGETGREVK